MSSIVDQLVVIAKREVWCGETDEELKSHFQAELERDELAWIESEGEVIAFCDWSWIDRPEDVWLVEAGRQTEGRVLFLMNVWCKEKGILFKLKSLLPPYTWMVYRDRLDYNKIVAPRGWPNEKTIEVAA